MTPDKQWFRKSTVCENPELVGSGLRYLPSFKGIKTGATFVLKSVSFAKLSECCDVAYALCGHCKLLFIRGIKNLNVLCLRNE